MKIINLGNYFIIFFRHLIAFILVISTISTVFSQSNEGTEFWFAFMQHRDVNINQKVAMITSKYDATGIIEAPGLGISTPFKVVANQVTLITLPQASEVIGSESVANKGLRLTCDVPVSLYLHQYANVRSEATIVLPVNSLGSSYYAMTYFGYNTGGINYPSQLIVVATKDNTTVTIKTNARTLGGRQKGEEFTVNLNQGQVYQVQGFDSAEDMTGSYISSDEPIAVFAGATWTRVPISCGTQDNLLEMMAPVSTWGKQFVSVPTFGSSYDIFRIIAAESGTVVQTSGTNRVNYSLTKGEFIEFTSSEPLSITSNKPIQVAQYLIGASCNGLNPLGDPSILLLNSIEQTKDTVTLYNSGLQLITQNYINIIMRTVDASTVKIDGQLLSSVSQINTIGVNGKYSYAVVKVEAGSHTITSKGCGVIANAYGYGSAESYAYSGGASFRNINNNPIPFGSCVSTKALFDTKLDTLRYRHIWTLGDGTTETINPFEKIYTKVDTYKLKLVIQDQCLETSDTFNRDYIVSIRNALQVPDTIVLCENQTLKLTASDIEKAKYSWSGPKSFKSEEQNPQISKIEPSKAGNYTVVGSYFDCPTIPSITNVVVHPLPNPFIGIDTFFCPRSETYDLSTSISYQSYIWSTNESTQTIKVDKAGKYDVIVTDQFNCSNSVGIELKAYCPPEVIVSNGLSFNALYPENEIHKIHTFDVDNFNLSIFDRLGNIIWQTEDSANSWNGTFNGQRVNPGVYPYIISYSGKDIEGNTLSKSKHGAIHILE